MADALVYLYAVTDAGAPDPGVAAGVDAAPVRRVVAGRLAAVVSPVDPVRFSEEALHRSLEDLQWLEATARAHHAVVAAAARVGPVAPVRLATVYLDEDRVRGLLSERADAFAAALDRVRGRVEWGVKGFAVPPDEPVEPPAAPGAGPGASYLARRLAERNRAARGEEAALAAAEEAHRALAAVAHASRRYPPQDPRLTGRREPMVLNAAYLVDADGADDGADDGAAALRRVVEEHSTGAVRLELTGPWAPYSFATLEEP